jgi:hypothetical protein
MTVKEAASEPSSCWAAPQREHLLRRLDRSRSRARFTTLGLRRSPPGYARASAIPKQERAVANERGYAPLLNRRRRA